MTQLVSQHDLNYGNPHSPVCFSCTIHFIQWKQLCIT